MPKPVKKASGKLPVPPKPKRPTDPTRAAKSILAEHMARVTDTTITPPQGDPLADPIRAYMAKIGAKGGRTSGAKRMTNLSDRQRREIALKGARARWAKTKGGGTPT
jgi:hypothetical protein